MKHRNAPIASPCTRRHHSTHAQASGCRSRSSAGQDPSTSSSHRQRSGNDAPSIALPRVAWNSLPLLNGGSVATSATLLEFMPRMSVRLSP